MDARVGQLPIPGLDRHGAPKAEPARPVVKWAGGKTRLLRELCRRLPRHFERYFEPFMGGGALFFRLQPHDAWLSDINPDLIQLYEIIREHPESLIAELRDYPHDRDFYYRLRGIQAKDIDPVARAARTLYLNRTCFNGLYRVNRAGRFNVPFGRYRNPLICDPDTIRAASRALQGRHLACLPFEVAADEIRAGDLVYFDPPYHPVGGTARFVSYADGGFGAVDQARLQAVFVELTRRGAACLLTNSDTELSRDLYADFRVDRVLAPRPINRDPAGRGPVGELIIRGYDG
jgi:DNA adenine methylase